MNVRRPTEADAPAVTGLVRAAEARLAGKPEQSEQDLRTESADSMHVASSFVVFEKDLAA